MTRHPVIFISFSRTNSDRAAALRKFVERNINVGYSIETETFPASPPLRTEGLFGSGIKRYFFGRPAYRAKDGFDFAEMPSAASRVAGDLSASDGTVVIVLSNKLSILEGSHRRSPAMFDKASSGARAHRATALNFFTQRVSDALAQVKARFVPDLARGEHGNEARAASAGTAAARHAALENLALHEVAHWCIHPNVQPRRLAPALAAADAPVPCTAIPGTVGHVCKAVSWDFVSERSVWPATLDLAGELVKGPSVRSAGLYATLQAAGRSTVSGVCIRVHGPGGSGKSGLAAAYACRHGIETVPAGTSQQFVDADKCVPFLGGLLPTVWQPERSGPESRGFEVAAQPAPAAAASIPNGVAGWTGVSGLLCVDNGMYASLGDIEMFRYSGDGVPGKNGMTGSIVSDPGHLELLDGGSGSETVFCYTRDALIGSAGNDMLTGFAGSNTLVGFAGNDTPVGFAGNDILTGGAGNDTFAFRGSNGSDTIADFKATSGHDCDDLVCGLWHDAFVTSSYTGWTTDAATVSLHEGPLIDWDAAAARRKSDVVSCEITDLFEDDTTACIFPRRARDLFYGREIPPGDKPVGRAAAAEREAGIINFAPRKSNKKTPGDIADAAAAR